MLYCISLKLLQSLLSNEYVVSLSQVEPNAHRIEEHRRKYDRLRKERKDRKNECERQRRKAEAQVHLNYLFGFMFLLLSVSAC